MNRRSRRDFLLSAGAAALAAPFLNCARGIETPAFGRSSSALASAGRPKRLVIFFSPNGCIPDHFWPTAGAIDSVFTLSDTLKSLEPFKQDILIPRGLALLSVKDDPNAQGHNQIAHVLTSTKASGSFIIQGEADPVVDSAGGISVDQYIARQIGQTTPFSSIELAVQVNMGLIGQARISYEGVHRPRTPDEDPTHAFGHIFADAGKSPAELARIRARRQSTLDYLKGDLGRLRNELGNADQQRLDAHLQSWRELERGLQTPVDASCVATPPEKKFDTTDPGNFPNILKAQIDLLVMALACGRTNVGSIQAGNAANYAVVPTWLGLTEDHHELSHKWDQSPEMLDHAIRLNTWFTEQFAYLLGKLKAIPEGDGTTMLDNTVVLWVTNQGNGPTHSISPMPFIIAGGRGYFRLGRYVQLACKGQDDVVPHGRLLVSLCNAFGIETSTFGDPAYCVGGPLDRLT